MYRQGTIKLVVNADADGTAEAFVAAHGPAASVRQGVVYRRCRSGPQSRLTWRPSWRWRRVGLRNFRYGNRGAGGCLICVVDEGPRVSSYRVDFIIKADVTVASPAHAALVEPDHLTHDASAAARIVEQFCGNHFDIREVPAR